MLDFSRIETIDFHAHSVREYNLSQWVEHLGLAMLESVIPKDVLRTVMIARGDLLGVHLTPERQKAYVKKAEQYEKSLGISNLLERQKRELTSLPSFDDLVLYLAKTYGCKPILTDIDRAIDDVLRADPTGYVSSVLDRENIKLALLDLLGHKDVEPPFPHRNFGLLFCPTKSIINPIWAMEHESTNLDDTLKLCEEEIKDVEKRKFSGFKCEIAYFRTMQIRDVDQDQANKAYKALRRAKPVGQDLWETVPIYRKSSDKHNLETYQDFMMRYVMSKAADLKVHVQFHTGCGLGAHNLSHANPTLLYELLMDDDMKRTKVVLLHTGYPFVEEAALMAAQFPNVYIDISVLLLFHGAYKQSLKTILEFVPHQKILYSSDAITFPELYAYHGWFIKSTLKEILTEFITSHGWNEERCMEVAEMILNGNAKGLGVRKAA